MTDAPSALAIKQIDTMLSRRANAKLEKLGVTLSQVAALRAIASHSGGRAAFKELERDLDVSQPTVAGLIGRLKAKELVVVFDSEETLNAKVVALTGEGRAVIETSREDMELEDETMFSGFTDEERAAFASMVERIAENLREK